MATEAEYTISPTSPLINTLDSLKPGRIPAIGPGITAEMVIYSAFTEWLAAGDQEQESLIQTFRDYYNGETQYTLTDRMKQFLQLDANIKFDLNYLPIPVDVLVERLSVIAFETEEERNSQGVAVQEETTATKSQSAVFDTWWQKNRLDARQGDVHHAAVRDGDSYLLVAWNDEMGMPTFSCETAYDGTNGMIVRYDESEAGDMLYAIKRWRIENGPLRGKSRMNVYTPAAIYKFITSSDGWVQYLDYSDTDGRQVWPIPWMADDGQPLGVPVAHFKNNSGNYDYGKSELKDLIPAQDALNKAVIDELAGADMEGFRIITLSGGAEPEGLTVGPGRILYAPDGNWGGILAGNLKALSDLVFSWVIRLAQLSRTPVAYFQVTGQIAAADTQRADDTGLVSKAENRSVTFGNAWEEAMGIGRRLHNRFGGGEMAEDVLIYAVWDSFERVDAGELDRKQSETNQMKAEAFQTLVVNGVPRELAARLAGYDEDTAVEIGLRAARVLPQDRLIESEESDE